MGALTDADIVFQSYGRCNYSASFYEDFYKTFIEKSPAISDKFRDTNMERQQLMLRGGIKWLLTYALGMPDTKLQELGKSHSRGGLNILPEWYDLWVEALMETVAKHDSQYTSELGDQWRGVLQPGIELIKSQY
ncbi:globin [Kistimonas asteriae]|uniref:globin n=1 Tax=Kistimonas asteriae TaxID=517724 RepID=UPI001BAA5499|nr:globin [Kistimonas asteriae]